MALSVAAIKAARPRGAAYKLTDGGGLYLLVNVSGARYWRMNYRYLGKQKTLAFGVWPGCEAGSKATTDLGDQILVGS